MGIRFPGQRLSISKVNIEQRNPKALERRKAESQIPWTLSVLGKSGASSI
jgi:hypothetical protein